MHAGKSYIGVDIGTTSTKAVAFSGNGEVLCRYAVFYPIISLQPGQAEQDPEVVLEAVLETLGQVLHWLRERRYSPATVSFSAAMHSLLLMGKDGQPLTRSIIWADTRSHAHAEDLKKLEEGHQVYLQTGTPLHPMSPLVKLRWLSQEQPELLIKTECCIGIKEYVLHRFFGSYVTDHSMASATGLFDLFSTKWHPKALQLAGVSPAQLPEPVPTTYVLGGLREPYKSRLQLPEDFPFVIGASDGCLANLASHAVRPGEAVVTIGTSGAVRVISSEPATDLQERVFSYILNQNHYVLGGAVNNGGVALRWFRDAFYPSEAKASEDPDKLYALLNKEAATIAAGANGLLFLPYLLGERAPVWDAQARGAFVGADFSHSRAHFLRAVMEGVVFGVYSVAQALEQTVGPIQAVYANGGFARSELWVQLLADVFGKEVRLTETTDGSAFGAAMLGMHALGHLQQLEDAEELIRVKRKVQPHEQRHSTYQQVYQVYAKLYPALQDSFRDLARIHSSS